MAVKLLDNVTGTGVGPHWKVRAGTSEHTLQLKCTGSPTAITTTFEGSLDSGDWFPLASHVWDATELSNQAAMFHVSSKLLTNFRMNLEVLTGGTAPTVTSLYEWEDW